MLKLWLLLILLFYRLIGRSKQNLFFYIMVTFASIDQPDVIKTLAASTLLQLYRMAAMPSCAVTSIDNDSMNQYFEKGQTVSLKRNQDLGDAQDYDPRSGIDAQTDDDTWTFIDLTLERLFTRGYSIFSHDADVARYIEDYSTATGGAIRKSFDDYLYNVGFRTYNIAASGAVQLAGIPPLAIVASEDASGNLQEFGKDLLINAGKVLDSNNVPLNGRCARLGTTAKAGFLGDAVMIEGFAGAQASLSPGASLIATGMGMQLEVPRYGFMVRGSNAVTGQSLVTDLGDGTPTDTITAVVDDTTVFFAADLATTTPVGAVKLTLGVTAALNAGVAVGKIARIGLDAGAATAYGVILRVDSGTKEVWLVPYNLKGDKLTAADISITTDKFGIPKITEVNAANHRQSLVYASRLLTPPSSGSGAISGTAVDPESGLIMQVLKGDYNIHQFKEGIRSVMLCGATATDYRKGVLMLST